MNARPTSVILSLLPVVAIVTMLVGCAPVEKPVGPLPTPPPHGYGGIIVDLGKTFTDAFENLAIEGKQSLTITDFDLIDTPSQIELVDVLIAGDQREANYQWESDFPPRLYDMGPLEPAIGATLLPLSRQSPEMGGYSLIIGMRITSPGKWVRGGYRITYTADGQSYVNEVVAQITICTPDAVDVNGECLMEANED